MLQRKNPAAHHFGPSNATLNPICATMMVVVPLRHIWAIKMVVPLLVLALGMMLGRARVS